MRGGCAAGCTSPAEDAAARANPPGGLTGSTLRQPHAKRCSARSVIGGRSRGGSTQGGVCGKVGWRSLEAWLAQLAERDDRPAAALRGPLIEKANEVELLGIPRHPNASILTGAT